MSDDNGSTRPHGVWAPAVTPVTADLAPDPARRLNVHLRSEDRNWVDAEELKLRLLQILRERGRLTNAAVRAISGYSRVQARDFMAALREEGQVALVGRGRAAHYIPASDGGNSWN